MDVLLLTIIFPRLPIYKLVYKILFLFACNLNVRGGYNLIFCVKYNNKYISALT